MTSTAPARILVHMGDRIVAADEARIPVLDHGFLFGDSVYDVVRTANGRPFMLQEHIDRLRRSGAMIYFDLPWSDGEFSERIAAVYSALHYDECYFRIVATRGPGPITLLPDGCVEPGLYIIGREIIRYPDRLYESGAQVAVVHRLRNDPRALDPKAKTGNYLNNMLGLIEAHRRGADDALFLNAEENLTEATTSNLWLVEGGRIFTPTLAEGLLPGITRQWVFETLPAAGVEVAEAVIDYPRLMGADEVFLSGTVKGIMPISRIDDRLVSGGEPGPVTSQAADLYRDALARN